MRRVLGFLVAASLAVGSATAGNGEMFLSIYGGYSKNDSSATSADGATADDDVVYGLRWGGETPAAGGQISLGINHTGDIRMDTLLFSILFNFASTDKRKGIGRVIYNRASGFVTTGIGAMLYDDRIASDRDLVFAGEVGIGTQFKFTRVFGIRAQLNAIAAPAKSIWNYEGTLGIAFHW